jgi:hypothetical protein
MQKAWRKPELVVVVRGAVEERTLIGCKTIDQDSNPGMSDSGCDFDSYCTQCNVGANS